MSLHERALRYFGLAVLLVALCGLGPALTGCGGGGDVPADEPQPKRCEQIKEC